MEKQRCETCSPKVTAGGAVLHEQTCKLEHHKNILKGILHALGAGAGDVAATIAYVGLSGLGAFQDR